MQPMSLREAERSLLERRRTQTGSHTLGDDADRALLAVLATLPASSWHEARASGRRLGEHVYSRRFLDDDLQGAVAILSHAVDASGMGALRLAEAFHRSATLLFEPGASLAPAHPSVREAFIAGVLEGYLATAFNCDTIVVGREDELRVHLGAGRDVNALSRRDEPGSAA